MSSLRFRLMSLAALALIAFAAAPAPAQQRSAQRGPLAVVESKIFTLGDVEMRIAAELADADDTLAGRALEAERRRIIEMGVSGWLNRMVEEKLFVLEGRRLIEEDERLANFIEAEIERIWKAQADRLGGEAQYHSRLMTMGLTPARERERIRDFLLARLVNDRYINMPTSVTPAEVRAYYRENQAQYRSPGRVEFQQIFVPYADFESRDRALERAQWIRRNIAPTGADFSEWARRHSKGPRAEGGGKWDLAEWEVESPELREGLSAMNAGEISDPLAGPTGYYIFMATRVVREHAAPLREVQEDIRASLIESKREHRRNELLEQLRRRFHVEVLYSPGR